MENKWNFYIKLTKHCNLRCAYCFEQEYFQDPRFLTTSDIALIFKKIKSFCSKNKIKRIHIGFTGGEPLILGEKYFSAVFSSARIIFKGSAIKVGLGVQTNLTLLTKEYLRIFKKYHISVGTSYDVFGCERKFKNGDPVDRTIIDKMIMLLENRVNFGAIAVITKINCKEGKRIFDFYNNISCNFHTLKMHAWPEKRFSKMIPSDDEYIECLKTITEKYFALKKPNISISNIKSYVYLLKNNNHYSLCSFTKNCLIGNVFIENNGDVYPCCSLRHKEMYLGNILHESLDKMFNSPILKKLNKRYRYIQNECAGCKYIDICNGGCMGMAYLDGNIMGKSRSCCKINKAMFKFIGDKINKMKVIPRIIYRE